MSELPIDENCIFCRANSQLENEVLTSSAEAYVIAPTTSPENYLIIPKTHYTSLEQLPDNWWHEMKTCLASLKNLGDYNLSINLGEQAGQRLKHLHFWVVRRDAGKPSSTKGLAALIAQIDENGRIS
jgi:diadenosine tetraphosphate (Ap4A) HIT family hydrolase